MHSPSRYKSLFQEGTLLVRACHSQWNISKWRKNGIARSPWYSPAIFFRATIHGASLCEVCHAPLKFPAQGLSHFMRAAASTYVPRVSLPYTTMMSCILSACAVHASAALVLCVYNAPSWIAFRIISWVLDLSRLWDGMEQVYLNCVTIFLK